jgi:hypothetical protein
VRRRPRCASQIEALEGLADSGGRGGEHRQTDAPLYDGDGGKGRQLNTGRQNDRVGVGDVELVGEGDEGSCAADDGHLVASPVTLFVSP